MYRSLIIAIVCLFAFASHAEAATPTPSCNLIYGGGELRCDQTKAAILQKNTPTPQSPTMTKGGLPVHSPTQTKKTPETGPEALALIGLIPTAGLGFWLRKKTTIS